MGRTSNKIGNVCSMNDFKIESFSGKKEFLSLADDRNPEKILRRMISAKDLGESIFPSVTSGIGFLNFLICARLDKWPKRELSSYNGGPRSKQSQNNYKRMWEKILANDNQELIKIVNSKSKWNSNTFNEKKCRSALIKTVASDCRRIIKESIEESLKKELYFNDFIIRIFNKAQKGSRLYEAVYAVIALKILFGVKIGDEVENSFSKDDFERIQRIIQKKKNTDSTSSIILGLSDNEKPPYWREYKKILKNGKRPMKSFNFIYFFNLYKKPLISKKKNRYE